MGILFGQQKRQAFPEPRIPAYPGAANDYVNNSTAALASPSMRASVMIIANSVSMLTVETFGMTPEGIAKRAKDPRFLTSPEPGWRQSEWFHSLMLSLLIWGNAYAIVSFLADGITPDQVLLLSPEHVIVERDRVTGTVSYVVIGANGQRTRHLPVGQSVGDLWHIRCPTLPGSVQGSAPMSDAAQLLGIDFNARRFANDFFSGSQIPKALLTTTADLDQTKARTAKDRIISATTSREPLVLGGDWKYQPLTVAPNESQFLETQKKVATQIANFFNVPPEWVGGEAGGNMTYQNVEQRSLDFLTYCIQPWLTRIEQALYIFASGKTFFRFNTDELLRTDAETRARIDVQLIAGKIMTPTEIRARRNMPEMTQAQKDEVDLVPLTVTPMGGAKALPGLTQPGGPPAPAPTKPDGSNDGEETQ